MLLEVEVNGNGNGKQGWEGLMSTVYMYERSGMVCEVKNKICVIVLHAGLGLGFPSHVPCVLYMLNVLSANLISLFLSIQVARSPTTTCYLTKTNMI